MSKWLILGLTLAALGCLASAYFTDVEDYPGKINGAAFAYVAAFAFGVLDLLVLLSTLIWRW